MTPRVLEDFELGEALGTGAFGTVYRATDLRTSDRVALKMARTDNVEYPARIAREIEALRRMSHPNIMPIRDYGDGWFTMPIARTLGQIKDEEKLATDEIRKMFTDIANGLSYAHQHGFVHRDLSPENIFRLDGRWVAGDWGLVGGQHFQTTLRQLTKSGMQAVWSAPECFTDLHNVDGRADIFSLAAIVGWLVSGHIPNSGTQTLLGPGNPWAGPVYQMTSVDRERRPATAQAAINEVNDGFRRHNPQSDGVIEPTVNVEYRWIIEFRPTLPPKFHAQFQVAYTPPSIGGVTAREWRELAPAVAEAAEFLTRDLESRFEQSTPISTPTGVIFPVLWMDLVHNCTDTYRGGKYDPTRLEAYRGFTINGLNGTPPEQKTTFVPIFELSPPSIAAIKELDREARTSSIREHWARLQLVSRT